MTATLRSARAGAYALLPAACGFAITFGVLSLLRVPLTLANFFALPLIIGIGVFLGLAAGLVPALQAVNMKIVDGLRRVA